METISGLQMVYTRVEDEYSPVRQSGYQTVYHSQGLPAADIEIIKRRVNSFQPALEGTFRRQFFTLPDGYVALTFSAGIPTHKVINDRYRARGMYLAHCLVFALSEYAKTNYNPYKIFDKAHFLTDAEQMVSQFNQAENREPDCRFEIDPYEPVLGGEDWWPSADRLVALAGQSQVLKSKGQSLLFYGPAAEIDGALRAVFQVVPAWLRLACSFDTCIDGCNVKAGQYWAVGSTTHPGESFLAIPTSGHRIDILPRPQAGEDLYLDWVQKMAVRSGSEMLPQVLTIQELSASFKQKRAPSQAALDEAACAEFFSLHSSMVIRNIQGIMERSISPALSEAFSAYLLHAEPSKKIILAIAAAQGVADRYLAHLMRDWLKTLAPEFTGLKKGDWKALLQFAVRAVDYLLIFLTACQLGDETQRQEALQKMSAADYQVALEFLEAPIHPVSFVRPDFLDTLLTSLEPVLDRVGDEDFVDFVKVMAGIGQTDRLAGVSGRVFTLQNKALTELEKIIKKEKFLPVDLIRAIKTQRYRLGPPYGLPSIFSRKSGSRPS